MNWRIGDKKAVELSTLLERSVKMKFYLLRSTSRASDIYSERKKILQLQDLPRTDHKAENFIV
jgi:hypothetical protein